MGLNALRSTIFEIRSIPCKHVFTIHMGRKLRSKRMKSASNVAIKIHSAPFDRMHHAHYRAMHMYQKKCIYFVSCSMFYLFTFCEFHLLKMRCIQQCKQTNNWTKKINFNYTTLIKTFGHYFEIFRQLIARKKFSRANSHSFLSSFRSFILSLQVFCVFIILYTFPFVPTNSEYRVKCSGK